MSAFSYEMTKNGKCYKLNVMHFIKGGVSLEEFKDTWKLMLLLMGAVMLSAAVIIPMLGVMAYALMTAGIIFTLVIKCIVLE